MQMHEIGLLLLPVLAGSMLARCPGPHPSARPTIFPHSFPRRSASLHCSTFFWSATQEYTAHSQTVLVQLEISAD